MYRLALELGIEVILDAKVTDYDTAAPSITLQQNQVRTADLIIAADGTWFILDN